MYNNTSVLLIHVYQHDDFPFPVRKFYILIYATVHSTAEGGDKMDACRLYIRRHNLNCIQINGRKIRFVMS